MTAAMTDTISAAINSAIGAGKDHVVLPAILFEDEDDCLEAAARRLQGLPGFEDETLVPHWGTDRETIIVSW